MQMNFENTPIDAKNGETLYLLVYTGGKGIWYSPVTFSDLIVNVKEDRWGHGDFFDVDYYTLIMNYLNDKGKKKEIKVKWKYSKKEKPSYKKSKNFVFFEDVTVTCTPIVDSSYPEDYFVYITKDIEKMKSYITENKIFENAKKAYEKELDHINYQINRINNYNI